jgi:hypothetical protein
VMRAKKFLALVQTARTFFRSRRVAPRTAYRKDRQPLARVLGFARIEPHRNSRRVRSKHGPAQDQKAARR